MDEVVEVERRGDFSEVVERDGAEEVDILLVCCVFVFSGRSGWKEGCRWVVGSFVGGKACV